MRMGMPFSVCLIVGEQPLRYCAPLELCQKLY